MPEIIQNVACQDTYSDAASIGPAKFVKLFTFLVSGNPVFATFWKLQYGDDNAEPVLEGIERFFQTGSIVSVDQIAGAKFRNANPGANAIITAELAFVGDPLIGFQSTGIALPTTVVGAITRQIFLVNGTYVPPTGVTAILVECIGGGGGGGGTAATGAGQAAAAGGGGGGGYSASVFPVSAIPVGGATVGVGVGGAGGVGVNGTVGGKTQFGPNGASYQVAAFGGAAGIGGAAVAPPIVGGSAVVGGSSALAIGDITADGGESGAGMCFGVGGSNQIGGFGGSAAGPYGGGGGIPAGPGGSAPAAGGQYGGGGSGAVAPQSVAARTGGAGANGILVITEFH